MLKHNQSGALNILLIPLIISSLLLIGLIVLAGTTYSSLQDYKNNSDKKVSDAVTLAKQQESTTKDKEFAEAEKLPLKTYVGPQSAGTINIKFPKTWSAYIDDAGTAGAPVEGYFYPHIVPSLTAPSSTFALRIKVLPQPYNITVQTFAGQQQSGLVSISPFSLPKVSSVIGIRVDGQVGTNKSGSMIVLPLRETTLEVWTENKDFLDDFNNTILANLTFLP